VGRYSLDDTIAAISTPLGEGGIGIVRMSGAEALAILQRLFRPRVGCSPTCFVPRQLTLGRIVDPASGVTVDEVLTVSMPAPHTFTRQDVVEINCHGGIVAARSVLQLCLVQGARPATAGEFTLRAFLNGRIDLAQAEAVLDLVRARTQAGLEVAAGQLTGTLSRRVRSVRSQLLAAQAHLVATLDFPEDEIPPLDLRSALDQSATQLDALIAGAHAGILYRHGVRAAIVGRPNVGKSSLLNALLRSERAIVAPLPGTTRDTVEEAMDLAGVPLVLVDTAGLAPLPGDPVEALGIARSRAAIASADLVLVVLDRSEDFTASDQEALQLASSRPCLLVLNKLDLPAHLSEVALPPDTPRAYVSAHTGEGLATLEQQILDLILGGGVRAGDEVLVTNVRHQAALQRAHRDITAALTGLQEGLPADCLSIDVASAVAALGDITGETAGEELLDQIFSQFCIGK
jgi:tRNA modification GTPase